MNRFYIAILLLSFFAISCSEKDDSTSMTIPTGNHKSIHEIKNNSNNELPTCFIEAVVISDRTSKNFDDRHAFVMDNSERGILLEFKTPHTFNLGDKIKVKLYKLQKESNDGLTRIENIPTSRASVTESNVHINPIEITIYDLLNSNQQLYECCLIKLGDVLLSKTSGNTFSYRTIVTQNTGYYERKIDLETESEATFANTDIMTQKLDLTAIVTRGNSYYSDAKLKIRSLNDLVIGKTSFNIDFYDSNPFNEDLGWTRTDNTGNGNWTVMYGGSLSNEKVAGVDGYYGETDAWLISPVINFDVLDYYFLEFKSAYNYTNKYGDLEVLYSYNYSGNINSADWTAVSATIVNESNDTGVWIDSGIIDLSNKNGLGNIAFRITKNDNYSNDPSVVIDNIVLRNSRP